MHPLLKTIPVLVLTTDVVARIKLGELSSSLTSLRLAAGFVVPRSIELDPETLLPWCAVNAADKGRAGGLAFRPAANAGLEER
jgi:hypothetical protein